MNDTWTATGSLNIGRYIHGGTVLNDGRALVAGGTLNGGAAGPAAASAETYDRPSETWSLTGPMNTGRWQDFTVTLLSSGEVLVAGGVTNWTLISTAAAETFDPASGLWTPTTSVPTTRIRHTATGLPDGTVLVAGGNDHPGDFGPGTVLDTAYIYDPAGETWTPTMNTMGGVKQNHSAVLVCDSAVLIAGGDDGAIFLASAELYGTCPAATGKLSGNGKIYDDGKRVAFYMKAEVDPVEPPTGYLLFSVCNHNAAGVCAGSPKWFSATSLDAIAFSDMPGGPPGLADTATYSGGGTWDNVPGHTFWVTATDGAPAGDFFHIIVRDSDGNVVFDLEGPVVSGNIKAAPGNQP